MARTIQSSKSSLETSYKTSPRPGTSMRVVCSASAGARALRLRPGSPDAHQIIAVCACSTKDREGAMKSYAKLDERSRAMVRTLCARNGIELE